MKILLLQTLDYLYCMGGAHKANRILMEALASTGCECKVVFPLYIGEEYYHETLNRSGVDVATIEEAECAFFFQLQGVKVSVVKGKFHLYSVFLEEVDKFTPDIILVTEDHTGLLLEVAFETSCRVVYISHTQATLPFGPTFFGNNARMLSLFEKLSGIISVSNYVKNYILEWSNLKSEVIYFPSYGDEPYELLGNYENEFITIINPSGIKGIDVFLEIAKRLTNVSFAAVPTWSTKAEDIYRMQQLNNITILEPEDDIDKIYKRTKILLVPSLWKESFGQVVVEAMLRGIPVIASDIGGLPEAIQGCDYIIPVKPIEKYIFNELDSGFPDPVVPEQNIDLWINAICELLEDNNKYMKLSQLSQSKANAFISKIGINIFVDYFKKIISDTKATIYNEKVFGNYKEDSKIFKKIEKIPPEKIDQLLMLMKQKKRRRKSHNKI